MKEVKKFFFAKIVALIMTVALLLNCLIISIGADESDLSKVYCTATLEDDFTNNEIIIVVFPEFNNKDYQIDDFSTINCIEIKELSLDVNENTLGRILKLTIEGESKQNVLDAINILEQRDDIYCAEPNYLEDVEVYPNDSMYVSNDQWAIDKISLPLAWNINKGSSSIKIGVIDSGIDASHPDLVGKVNQELSCCFTEFFDTGVEDVHGHGTMIAGIIAAATNNGTGIAGSCWNAQLVSLRVVQDNGSLSRAATIEAIEYAERNGIEILSYSGGKYSDIGEETRRIAIQNYSGLFVCSAGNSSKNTDRELHYPSGHRLPNSISVGASTEDDMMWERSNYGKNTVDIFAPGDAISTCYPQDMCEEGEHDIDHTIHISNGYHSAPGTSLATPYVTSVAALMMAENPHLTPAAIKQIIIRTADTVYDENGNSVFENLCVSGGRLNAYAALRACHLHTSDIVEQGDGWHTIGFCEVCELSDIEQPHSYLPYAEWNEFHHKAICSCGEIRLEQHRYDIFVDSASSETTHDKYCACGASKSYYHIYVSGAPGADYVWICQDCGITSDDYTVPGPQQLISGESIILMSAPGVFTLANGMTLRILTETGSYVLSNGIIVLSPEDAALVEAGLLDPYELVESVTVPAGPGHVTE